MCNIEPLLFAGRGGEREEGQGPCLPVGGTGSGPGLPGFGALLFQPEIPVEPRPGKGKTPSEPLVCQSSALLPPSLVSVVLMSDR